jgi:hypothetical protein
MELKPFYYNDFLERYYVYSKSKDVILGDIEKTPIGVIFNYEDENFFDITIDEMKEIILLMEKVKLDLNEHV